MGKALKKVGKGLQKLVGMDIDAGKDATNRQAAAIEASSKQQAQDSMYAAQAAQQQLEASAAQNAAREAASDLLGRPMESATVDMSDGASDDEEDLLGRKRGGVRNTYRGSGSSNAGLQL